MRILALTRFTPLLESKTGFEIVRVRSEVDFMFTDRYDTRVCVFYERRLHCSRRKLQIFVLEYLKGESKAHAGFRLLISGNKACLLCTSLNSSRSQKRIGSLVFLTWHTGDFVLIPKVRHPHVVTMSECDKNTYTYLQNYARSRSFKIFSGPFERYFMVHSWLSRTYAETIPKWLHGIDSC